MVTHLGTNPASRRAPLSL